MLIWILLLIPLILFFVLLVPWCLLELPLGRSRGRRYTREEKQLLQLLSWLWIRGDRESAVDLALVAVRYVPTACLLELILESAVRENYRLPEVRRAYQELSRHKTYRSGSIHYHLGVLARESGDLATAVAEWRKTTEVDDGGWRDQAREDLAALSQTPDPGGTPLCELSQLLPDAALPTGSATG